MTETRTITGDREPDQHDRPAHRPSARPPSADPPSAHPFEDHGSAHRRHPHRRLRVAGGWALVTLLLVHASWRGGLAVDAMLAIMEVVGLFSDDEVLPFSMDWFGMAHRTAALALATYVALATVRYQRRTRGACTRCGRPSVSTSLFTPLSTRRAVRIAAWLSAVPAVAYGALKLNWGFGGTIGLTDPDLFAGVRPWTPGMGDTAVMSLIGVGLALAMAYQWRRLPRWMLLAPAGLGIVLLLPVGVVGTVQAVREAVRGSTFDQVEPWVVYGIYPTFLAWGLLLALVTVNYYRWTRGACRRCGLGRG